MSDEIRTLLGLLSDPWFVTALAAALGGVGVAAIARAPAGWVGAVGLGGGVIVATLLVRHFRAGAAAGVVMAALVGGLITHPGVRSLLMAAAGGLIAWSAWRLDLVWPLVVASLVTALVAHRTHLGEPRVGATLAGMAAGGVWASVPETEVARALLGAALVVTAAAAITGRPLLTRAGIGALAGVLTWATIYGALGRPLSVFGAWTSMVMLGAVDYPAFARTPWWGWLTAQAVVVVIGARLAGVAPSVTIALVWSTLGVGGGLAIAAATGRTVPQPA